MRLRLTNSAGLILGLAIMAPAAFSAPAAALNETTFDFGYVPQNAKISHVFQIQSIGDDTLKIVQVVPGCGCTKAPLEKSELAPGESTRLEVIFSTGQYRGRVTKHPHFMTNEGQSKHPLQFISNVVASPDSTYPVIIQPAILDFTSAGETSPQTMTVSISNVSETDLGVSLVDFPEGILEVTVPKTIPAGGSADATIRLADASRAANFEKSFTIQLGDAGASRFTVPVKKSGAGSGRAEASGAKR